MHGRLLLVLAIVSLITIRCGKNEPEDVPLTISLTSPSNSATDVSLSAVLTWDLVSASNPYEIEFDVYLGKDVLPSSPVSTGQLETSYSPVLEAHSAYQWKVVAKDADGNVTESPVRSFSTLNNKPAEFNLVAPENGTGTTLNVQLSWQPTTDSDGDKITYDVYFGTETSPVTVVSSDQEITKYTPNVEVGTTYYWKIVSKDSFGGTRESEVWSFTTASASAIDWTDDLNGTFTDSRDNKTYNVIRLGTQIWMTENLAYEIPGKEISDNTEWKNNNTFNGWCYYKNDKANNGETYHILYQYEAAVIACPEGWHIPNNDEWNVLINYLGGASVAGGKMKTTGTSLWDDPNAGATNESGFSGVPGGARYADGGFGYLGVRACFWSSTDYHNTGSYYYILSALAPGIDKTTIGNNYGFSVRCILNQ